MFTDTGNSSWYDNLMYLNILKTVTYERKEKVFTFTQWNADYSKDRRINLYSVSGLGIKTNVHRRMTLWDQ